jgi:FkbM family methyltransferase
MPYMPSVFRIAKYGKYLMYCSEYMSRADVRTLLQSFNYVLFRNLPKQDRVVNTVMGTFKLRRNTTDFQFVNWAYETRIKEYLWKNIDNIGLFIDIGACIGEYCIWLGEYKVNCIAIEPVNYKAIFDNLSYNAQAERHTTVLPIALGKETKKVAFNVYEGVTSSSYMDSTIIGEIPCHTLDEVIDTKIINPKKVTFIKLDVEGMELDVLEGGAELIKSVENLQIVYEHTSLGDNTIRQFLNKCADFHYVDLDGVNTLATKIKKQPY